MLVAFGSRFRGCFSSFASLLLVALTAAPPLVAQNAIVLENQNLGSPPSEWFVPGPGDANIQGFATDMSVDRGETVHFKIDTDATAYHIDVYRLGWYQGLGARQVGSGAVTATLPQAQPAGLYDPATATTDCGNWSESAHWDVPITAVSGIYLAKLTRDDATPGTSCIVFVVRDDAGTSDLLLQTSDATWQAYNVYGGGSLYPALGGHAPGFNHATKVSYNRPFDIRHADGSPGDDVYAAEYPLVRWLERNGFDVSYTSSVDTDRRGNRILQHRAFLSVGHDEYWSGPQRANVTAARDAGVHLAFFSGNEVYWRTRYEPSIDGTSAPHRTLVCYKEGSLGENGCGSKCDPSPEWTGLWRDGCAPNYAVADACRPESTLTGQIGWDGTVGAIQVPDTFKNLRFWRNTSVTALGVGQVATLGSSTLGSEWDFEQPNFPYPPRRIRLSSTVLNGRTHHLSLYRADSGALVFGAGTIQWSWGLDDVHTQGTAPVSPDMQQATVNLFADMGIAPGSLQAGLVPAVASSDTSAPASLISAPLEGASTPRNTTVTISGIAADVGGGVVAGVEVSVDDGATWHAATGTTSWSYAWTPAVLGAVTIRARAFDDTCNLEAIGTGNVVHVTVTPPVCPCTVFPPTAAPAPPMFNDSSAIEVGMRFRADVSGSITALRYYKPVGATGLHVGSLWTGTGVRLAQQAFATETASGWQEVALTTPVSIAAGTTFVVSYFSPTGDYVATVDYFTQEIGGGLVHGLADGFDGSNGVYRYTAASAFPDQTFRKANYYADVVFTAATGETTPPTVIAFNPSPGAATVPAGAAVRATFSEDVQPATVGVATFELRDAQLAIVSASVGYDAGTRTAVLQPSAPLVPGASYTATLHGGGPGPSVQDLAGNALAADVSWTFSIAVAAAGPYSVLAAPTNVTFGNDQQPIEVGMRFRADVDGLVTALRYWKPLGATGVHTGSLWTGGGALLARQAFATETAAGWQEVELTTPVSITAGTTYLVSYFSPSGDYAATPDTFAQQVGNNLVHGLADGLDGPNGVFLYTTVPSFPTQTFRSSNYHADVVFYAAVPDLLPPEVVDRVPQPGAVAVPRNTAVTALFDGALDQSTVSAATCELRDAQGGLVPASISYLPATFAVRLQPNAALNPLAAYTVRLRGGVAEPRLHDASGNALAADAIWSFTTEALPRCPCSVFAASDAPPNPNNNDGSAIEVGMRFRPVVDGVVTALRYYRAAGAAGGRTGSLWTNGGVLLARQAFHDETASGWQQVMLSTPVPVTAGVTYVVSSFSPSGDYVSALDYFAQQVGTGLVRGLADGTDGPNGVFDYSAAPTLPTHAFRSSNYYVDVVLYAQGEARNETFGAGCPGALGVPALAAVGLPALPIQPNPTLGVALSNARPLAAAVFAAGTSRIGDAACTVMIGDLGANWLVITSVLGRATVPLAIPPAPSFLGLTLWLQGAVFDPTANSAFLPGLALTQGIALTIGN